MGKIKLDDYGIWVNAHRPRKPALRKIKTRQQEILERRKVVRRAFFMIRRDANQQGLVNLFASALGGSIDLTEDIFEKASQVVQHHLDAVLQ